MTITTTSVAFILLSLGLGICGWRFLRAFQKSGAELGGRIGFLLVLFLFGFAIQTGIILGVGTLFFAESPVGLRGVLIAANTFLTLLAILGVYMSYYIFWPRFSPLPLAAATLLIGAAALVFALTIPFQPFLTLSGSIEWNMPFPLALTTFYLLLISIGAQFYIFARLFFRAESREIKTLSFFLALLALGGVVDQFVRFFILSASTPDVRARLYDIGHALIGLGFIGVLVVAPFVRSWLGRRRDIIV